MSTKKTESKFVVPTKVREEFPVVGSVRLFKKKDTAPADAKGFIIRPLKPDGKEDFEADGYVIWFSALEALKTGGVNTVSAFLVKYQPKPEA